MTAGFTFFNTVSVSSTRFRQLDSRGRSGSSEPDILRRYTLTSVRAATLGHDSLTLIVNFRKARVEVPRLNARSGRNPSRHGMGCGDHTNGP